MSSFDDHIDYVEHGLPDGALGTDPVVALQNWLSEAEAAGLPDPNAMVVGTVASTGQPTSRTVLWKGVVDGDLTFFTNRESHKAEAIAHEARVSILFPWYGLHRQVRVEGVARFAADEESDAYWASRPRGSQLGAWASAQSRPIASRDDLDRQQAEVDARFADVDRIPRPTYWGGYLVTPSSFEFWQGRVARLHDRLLFTRATGGWDQTRLQP